MDFHFIVLLSVGIYGISRSAGSLAASNIPGDVEEVLPLHLEGVPDSLTKEDALSILNKVKSNAVVSYKRIVKDGNRKYLEEYVIDKNKQIEKLHIAAHRGSEEANIIREFKRNLAMYKIPAKKLCLLGRLEGHEKPPSVLAKDLENEKKNRKAGRNKRKISRTSATITKWRGAVSPLVDRSILSNDMAELCQKYPIYKITKKDRKQRLSKKPKKPSLNKGKRWRLTVIIEFKPFKIKVTIERY